MTDSPFLRRWHLYQGEQFEYTAIPLEDCIRLIGKQKPMHGVPERKSLLYSEYPSFIRANDLREVKP